MTVCIKRNVSERSSSTMHSFTRVSSSRHTELTGILSGCLARTLSPSALLTSSGTERWYWLSIWELRKETWENTKAVIKASFNKSTLCRVTVSDGTNSRPLCEHKISCTHVQEKTKKYQREGATQLCSGSHCGLTVVVVVVVVLSLL